MSDFRVLVLACVVLGGMGQGIVAPKLPELLQGSDRLALDSGISASLMYLGVFVSTFRFGRLADRGRVHSLLISGLIGYALVLVLLGVCPGEIANFALRFVEGLCLSAIFVSADYVLGRLSKPAERGEWLSYYGVAMSVGLLLGPAVALFSTRFSPSPLVPLFVVSCLSILLALSAFSKKVPPADAVSETAPQLNFAALMTGSAYGFLEAGLVAVLPVMAVQVFHVRPEFCLVVTILCAAASSILWGKISDRFGPRPVVRVLILMLIGGPLAAALAAGVLEPSYILFGSCALFGVLAGGLYPVGFAWLLESVGEAQYGYASGAFARAYGIGSLAGPLVVGAAAENWDMRGLLLTMACAGALTAGVVSLRTSVDSWRGQTLVE